MASMLRLWLCRMIVFTGVYGSWGLSHGSGLRSLAQRGETNLPVAVGDHHTQMRIMHGRGDLEASPISLNSTVGILLEFRDAVVQDPGNVLSSWNPTNATSYCKWTGILCNSQGQVSVLNLSGQNLTGKVGASLGGLQFMDTLNLSRNNFQGAIPASISNCISLAELDLSSNNLSGGIPSELQALSSMKELNLSGNALIGEVPSFLTNLANLTSVDLGSNQLGGNLSLDWGRLSDLKTLVLQGNYISGVIPGDSLSNCSNLVHLDLSTNFLSGDLTVAVGNFSKLRNLQFLNLSFNTLNGIIPTELGLLVHLQDLGLAGNNLTGEIPPSLGLLGGLQFLKLAKNSLGGTIPPSLGNCTALVDLSLRSNMLDGTIPPQFGNLRNLTFLDLGSNMLVGTIPTSLVNCSLLEVLHLTDNFLIGGLFPEIGNLSKLQTLGLGGNNLTGPIPGTLANCTSLFLLMLSYNQLGGQIPELGTLSQLKLLDLRFNNLDGVIPDSLGNCSLLQEVHVDSNNLTGPIPASLGNCKALVSLSLAGNELTGEIPSDFGGLVNLQGLDLSSNNLWGVIPIQLSNSTQLSILDLSGNLLGGTIPSELQLLMNLNKLDLSDNRFNSTSVLGLSWTNLLELNLAYNSLNGVLDASDFNTLRRLQTSLNLSHNQLSGTIPSEIGELDSVQRIDLSFNLFSGSIPASFNKCIGLNALDLSSNDLSGQIPSQLASLQALVYFNVSYNSLTGPIPDSGSFSKFTNASFLGNPGLCGPSLPAKCKSPCHGGLCHGRAWLLAIPGLAAATAALLGVAACWFCCLNGKGFERVPGVAPSVPSASHFTMDFRDLTIRDVMAATNGFSATNIVGMGAKSTVYAGFLPAGVIIAVKRLELEIDDKSTSQLLRLLQRLAQLEHPNLLKVHGFFCTDDLKALVLDHMANGSLCKQLHDGERCRLTWRQRLDIAIGVSEGMVYLHHAGSKPVLHLDLKPSNILLDAYMVPKIADYGISRFVNHENPGDASMSSNLYGTIGYIPPEYGASTSVSVKGDIYNFGIVLMELFTRKQPTNDMFGQDLSLCSWVGAAFPARISTILDSDLKEELAESDQEMGIHLLVRLAVACTREAPKDRPNMMQVRDMLMDIRSFHHESKSKTFS